MDAFNAYPADARRRHFVRRTKEEMVSFDGKRIYPSRVSDTLSYDLSQGEISEQTLYDKTTDYIDHYYNRARILNRSAARLAMSVFQRRLASSTYALLRSFERRLEKLDGLIESIKAGKITADELAAMQRKLDDTEDVFEDETGDEETPKDGEEENEIAEEKALGGVVAVSLAELIAEREQVQSLLDLAKQVDAKGDESKFDKLREDLDNPESRDEKRIIFTEHRDTLVYLVRRLEGLGFTGQIARIHGGMDFREREVQIEFFRKPTNEGGALYMVCTDAAGEGLNMQFAWRLLNWDIPWNPARLEQRMGRIHRYKQMHDPVYIINLVAGKTREGRVMKTLLEKLERIRKELGNDKVFDVIGRLFEGVSIKEYMEKAVASEGDAEQACRALEGTLTKEQVEALEARERRLYGDGGDVKSSLANEREKLDRESWRRLLPGYVRRFIEKSAPLLGLGIDGDLDGTFAFTMQKPGALDFLWNLLETYPPARRQRLTVHKPKDPAEVLFLHPGEPVFDRLRVHVCERFADVGPARRGLRGPDGDESLPVPPGGRLGVAEGRSRVPDASARRKFWSTAWSGSGNTRMEPIESCPVEHLAAAEGRSGSRSAAASFAFAGRVTWSRRCESSPARRWPCRLRRIVVGNALESLPGRLEFVERGYDYQDSELAQARSKLREKAQAGDPRAKAEFTKIKERQKALAARRENCPGHPAARARTDRGRMKSCSWHTRWSCRPTIPRRRSGSTPRSRRSPSRSPGRSRKPPGPWSRTCRSRTWPGRPGWKTTPDSTCSRTAPEKGARGIEVKGRVGDRRRRADRERVAEGVQPARAVLALCRLRLCHASSPVTAGPRPFW